MTQSRKTKIIHVDKIIIHAKDVEIIREEKEKEKEKENARVNPWDFFWGRPPRGIESETEEITTNQKEEDLLNKDI